MLTLLAVLVGLGLAGVGALAYWWHQLGTPPDVAATARSAPVDKAAVRAAGVVDPRLPAVVGPAPWLSPVSTGFADVCRTEAGSFIGSSYSPVKCTRTATQVLAADGLGAGHSKEWDRALRGAGWIGENEVSDPPGQMRYVDPAGLRLTVTWLRSPADPIPPDLYQQRYCDPETEVYRAEKAVDGVATQAAYQRFRYLVVVTASLQYYDATPPSPSPPPHPPGCPGRGAYRCPGG